MGDDPEKGSPARAYLVKGRAPRRQATAASTESVNTRAA
ncbi:MAG: hypothetical protein JWP47_281 [Polaromonas sp.]|nr:hypothetical protein [Polaromonas sp.]